MNTILLIDDDVSRQREMATFLESCGYGVRIAEPGPSPIPPLGPIPDVILTDLPLTGGGTDLIDEAHRRLPETPVIVTTGADRIADAVRAMKHGAFDYVTTPVDADELLPAMQRAAEWSQLKREVRRLREIVGDAGARAARSGTLAELERDAIQRCLLENEGNRKRTADMLGISTRTLLRKIREYDLKDPLRRPIPAEPAVP